MRLSEVNEKYIDWKKLFNDLYKSNKDYIEQESAEKDEYYRQIKTFIDHDCYGCEIVNSECRIIADQLRFTFAVEYRKGFADYYCIIYSTREEEFVAFY